MCTTSSELGKVLRQQEVGLRSGEVINSRDFGVDFSTPTGATSEKWRAPPTSGAEKKKKRKTKSEKNFSGYLSEVHVYEFLGP